MYTYIYMYIYVRILEKNTNVALVKRIYHSLRTISSTIQI